MMLKSQLKRFHPSSLAQIFDVPDTIMSEYINWLKLENVDRKSKLHFFTFLGRY